MRECFLIPLSNPDSSAPEPFLHSLAVSTLESLAQNLLISTPISFLMADLIFSCCNLNPFSSYWVLFVDEHQLSGDAEPLLGFSSEVPENRCEITLAFEFYRQGHPSPLSCFQLKDDHGRSTTVCQAPTPSICDCASEGEGEAEPNIFL